MVNFLILFLLAPLFLFSGEFHAAASRSEVGVGETITLTLTLKEASAKVFPSTESLKNDFLVQSQQQFSNTVFQNGAMSSTTGWKLVLIPQKEGGAADSSHRGRDFRRKAIH